MTAELIEELDTLENLYPEIYAKFPLLQKFHKQTDFSTFRRLYNLFSDCGCCQQSLNDKYETYPQKCGKCEVFKEIQELLSK